MSFKHSIEKLHAWFAAPQSRSSFFLHLALLVIAAMVLRMAAALPALQSPDLLFRPDSLGYFHPAEAIAAGEGFCTAPGTGIPEAIRPVGYPALLALGMKLWGGALLPHALVGIFLSALTAAAVALLGRRLGSPRGGLLAGWLMALNLTSVATSPLFLSDTLLAFLTVWQFYFGWLALKRGGKVDFALFVLFAGVSCYVKPVNLPVVLCGVPVLAVAAAHSWRKFTALFLEGAVLGALCLAPLLAYNYRVAGDWDGNTPNAYFHNGSAILAFATGESSELWRELLLMRAEAEFASNPELYATPRTRNAWKKREFAALVRKFPIPAILTHLPQAANLIPDAPTLLENNRATTTGRGTMAVLRQKGVLAAVSHYLDGRMGLLVYLVPFLLVWGVTMLAAIYRLAGYLGYRHWRELLAFGVFVFYYLWSPGPVISPRYLLPALPMIAWMAAEWLTKGNAELEKIRK